MAEITGSNPVRGAALARMPVSPTGMGAGLISREFLVRIQGLALVVTIGRDWPTIATLGEPDAN